MCKKEKKEILRILLPLIFTFLLNSVVYWGAPLIKTGIAARNLSSSVDRIVPFYAAIHHNLFWMLYILGCELSTHCGAERGTQVSIFYC